MTAETILAVCSDTLERAIGPVPGAALGVISAARDRAVQVLGYAQLAPEPVPMERGTWFDLASLTKVIFTTTAILRLVAEGRIGLDDPLTVALPDLRQYDLNAAERRLTFRQCLAHQTHLPAVEPLYTYGQDPTTLRAFILQRFWQAGPPVYSDINFMLLGITVERLTGQSLADQRLPPGLTFRPDPAACAATERCTWRGRVLRGEVHDENAFALGGASGHAGLFGTIDGVSNSRLVCCRGLIRHWRPSARVSRSLARWGGRHDIRAGRGAISVRMRRSDIPVSPGPGYGSISREGLHGRC